MTTPNNPERRLMAAGAKKSSAWGTAVALGAGDGLLITDDGGLKTSRPYTPIKEADTPVPMHGVIGVHDPVDFAPPFNLRYDGGALNTLLAMVYGTAGTPTLDSTSLAYKHVLQLKDSIKGLFATFCVERVGKIYEVPSAKPYALSLNVADGIIKGSVSLRGDIVKDDSTTNTATQIDALTYVDRENVVRFANTSIKMNAESGGDVSSETGLEISDLKVEITRSLDGEHVANQDGIIEPIENAHPVIKVTLNFPRMSAVNAAYFAEFKAETTKKLLIKSTGNLIEDTSFYDFALFFPKLRIVDIDNPFNEVIPSSITLEAEEASAAPTGMDHARHYAEIINIQTTDYLA